MDLSRLFERAKALFAKIGSSDTDSRGLFAEDEESEEGLRPGGSNGPLEGIPGGSEEGESPDPLPPASSFSDLIAEPLPSMDDSGESSMEPLPSTDESDDPPIEPLPSPDRHIGLFDPEDEDEPDSDPPKTDPLPESEPAVSQESEWQAFPELGLQEEELSDIASPATLRQLDWQGFPDPTSPQPPGVTFPQQASPTGEIGGNDRTDEILDKLQEVLDRLDEMEDTIKAAGAGKWGK